MTHKTGILYLIAILSGAAGLGYEMVWTRSMGLALGHEFPAVLAVLGAFFAGMALGAWALGERIRCHPHPHRWYVGLEVVIGVWSFVLAATMPAAARWIGIAIGPAPSPLRHWSIAFGGTLLLLAPATIAMGATLPAMEQMLMRLRRTGRFVGGIYGANTMGGVLGTVAATFWLVTDWGIRLTAEVMAVCNLFCAAGAVAAFRCGSSRPMTAVRRFVTKRPISGLYVTLFLTGLLGISYEVVAIRVLSQVLENTVYSFAAALAVYLFGTAAGAALYQRFGAGAPYRIVLARLLTAISLSCLAGTVVLSLSAPLYSLIHLGMGQSRLSAYAAEMVVALSVFLLPTMAMGAVFSHLAQAVSLKRGSMGKALAVNMVGSAAAPILFGPVLLPVAGIKPLLLLVSLAYLVLLPAGRRKWSWVPAAAALVLAVSPVHFSTVSLPPGGQLAAYKEGVMASVAVVKDRQGEHHLKVNNHFQMGGTTSVYSDHRQAHIPLLLHPDPRHALFLGLGTAATFSAAFDHPGLDAQSVELIPEILPLLPYFEKATGDRMRQVEGAIVVADARRYIQACDRAYDVIVGDLFHPARDGAAALYTVEHFRAVRNRLAPKGLFCQWLPLYQLDAVTLKTIIRSFLHVFPESLAFLNHFSVDQPIIGLIGAPSPLRYPPDWFSRRVTDPRLDDALNGLELQDFYALFGCFLADGRGLAAYAEEGPLNTDDRPTVLFSAPSVVYTRREPAYRLLLNLLHALSPRSEALISSSAVPYEKQTHNRLTAYWAARNHFIETGVGVKRTGNLQALLNQVRDPLLNVVRQSPDFDPAYRPLVSMAAALHRQNPQAAYRLLKDLSAASPDRPEANQLLNRLSALTANGG